MKTIAGLVFLLVLAVPLSTRAETINAGFVEGLWYSELPVFANKPVRIYAALRNNTESDLTATVEFRDGTRLIARTSVSALSGRLIETWADTTFSFGDHAVSATLTNIRVHAVGETARVVDVSHASSEQGLFVDFDTDADGVGNAIDADDDNDGVNDEDEVAAGTDPLASEPPEEERTVATSTETASETTDTEPTDTTSEREGLERYFDDGIAKTTLSNVTDRIDASKQALDTYREQRNEARKNEPPLDSISLTTTGTTGGLATITRTRVGKNEPGVFESILDGFLSVFSVLYTLLLFITSILLGYPGLIQLLLLLSILIVVYKLARRFGRRRQYY